MARSSILNRAAVSNRTAKSNRATLIKSQNLIAQSNNPGVSPWIQNTGTTVSINTSDLTDPLGGNTASKIIYDGSGALNSYKIAQALGVIAYHPHTASFWARVLSGTHNMNFGDNITFTNFAINSTWQKFTVSSSAPNSANLTFSVYDNSGTNAAFNFYIWHPQMVYANWAGVDTVTEASAINTGNMRNIP